ncbi:MAG: dicarboxylate/amino acid:cation symporter [Tepidiformaceae bacterium]
MSPTLRVLVGLVSGLATGAALAAAERPSLSGLVAAVEPVGTLWLSALRMTVIPLVVSLLITGVASTTDTSSTGRMGARALFLIVVFLTAAALFSALVTPALLAWWPIEPATASALRAGAGGVNASLPAVPRFSEWVTNIVPTNPFQAAAEGAMLPLVVFALFFGFAATRIPLALRERLLGFFQAVGETMLVIVKWVLWAAPVGVFALALGVGLRAGIASAGALVHYVVLLSALSLLITVGLYPLAVIGGRFPLGLFARAAAPAQVVAFTTQSSLASLPAMIEGAQRHMGLPARITGLVLPLAVSVFRITSPPVNLATGLFVASLYNLYLTPAQIAAGAVVAVVTSVGIAGLPGQTNFFATVLPICLTLGVPIEVLPLLLAVDVIPDIFKTVGNVTADLTVTGIVARRGGAGGAE